MKARAPIVKELHFSKEQIAAVKSIQKTGIITKRKDSIRSVLDGLPLCCICSLEVPTRKVEYDTGRLETYCDKHFPIYERNKDVDINKIASDFNCERASAGYMSKIKVQGFNEGYSKVRPKSSLADRTIICARCRVTRIYFNNAMRATTIFYYL